MQNFKSKFESRFSGILEGDHGIYFKNIIKVQYLRSKKLTVRTPVRVFIVYLGPQKAQSLESKAIEQFVTLIHHKRMKVFI